MKFHQRLLARIFGKHEGKCHTDKSKDQAVFGMLTLGLFGQRHRSSPPLHLNVCICGGMPKDTALNPVRCLSYPAPSPAALFLLNLGRSLTAPFLALCRLIWCGLIGFFRSRASLEAEILVLRHQLNVLRRKSSKSSASASRLRRLLQSHPNAPVVE